MKTELNADGFDKAKRAAGSVSGEMAANELFPDAFIATHTRFATMQEMVNASGLESLNLLQTQEWADFAAAHSDFDSWSAMVEAAVAERFKRSLSA